MGLLANFLAAVPSGHDADRPSHESQESKPAMAAREAHSFAQALALLRGPRLDAFAFVISALTSPFLVCAVAAGAIAMHLAPSWRDALIWGGFTGVFAGVVPFLFVYLMYARGRVTDLHVAQRERRYIPLGASVVSGALGLLALWSVDAPLPLSALVVAYIVNAIIFIVISFWWKASVHAATYAGAFTSCALVLGPWWWAGILGVPLVIWARSRRGRHTILQGVVGAAVACGTTIAAYSGVMHTWS